MEAAAAAAALAAKVAADCSRVLKIMNIKCKLS